jgi:TRAP-type mannitol/chloroaromatic compound transport system permease small subunit
MSAAQPSHLMKFSEHIDAFSRLTGKMVAWLTLIMMIVSCVVVVLRYGFGIGSIALQESVGYMHAMVFMLGAAFTLQRQGHVRVDIFYRDFSERRKAWVNALGSLVFLLPISGFLLGVSWEFVANAWEIRESSPQADGIPGVYLLKSLLPLMAITLGLQGLSDIARAVSILISTEQEESA